MKTNGTAKCTKALERLSDDIRLFQMQSTIGGGPSTFLAERMAGLQASIAAELEERKHGFEPPMETEEESPREHERAA